MFVNICLWSIVSSLVACEDSDGQQQWHWRGHAGTQRNHAERGDDTEVETDQEIREANLGKQQERKSIKVLTGFFPFPGQEQSQLWKMQGNLQRGYEEQNQVCHEEKQSGTISGLLIFPQFKEAI